MSLEPLTQKSPAGAKAAESTQEEWPVRRAAGEGELRSWTAWRAHDQVLNNQEKNRVGLQQQQSLQLYHHQRHLKVAFRLH